MPLDTQELLAKCHQLKDSFAINAKKHDINATFPVESYEELRKTGMMGLMVSESHGGMGANFYQYTRAAGIFAQGCAATAVTFNMHNIVMGALAEADLSKAEGRFGQIMKDFQNWAFAEAMDGKLFAAALTEPNVGFHPGSLNTTYKKVEGGYLLNGKKSFVSMSGHADYYVVAAVPEVQPGGDIPVVSWLVLSKDDEGIEIEDMWDTMGMRGTVSNNMKLKDVFVPRNRLFLGFEGLVLQKLAAEPHFVVGGFTACYMGVIEA
ncbi:MAG: acyl-CoA/acyl-ACP dehydrogenase, partial [Kangiellaceae bacterium]|nr:acyl-CoA/acyl-ACP dehydrogenase [Kangiellaceae bacterium]